MIRDSMCVAYLQFLRRNSIITLITKQLGILFLIFLLQFSPKPEQLFLPNLLDSLPKSLNNMKDNFLQDHDFMVEFLVRQLVEILILSLLSSVYQQKWLNRGDMVHLEENWIYLEQLDQNGDTDSDDEQPQAQRSLAADDESSNSYTSDEGS